MIMRLNEFKLEEWIDIPEQTQFAMPPLDPNAKRVGYIRSGIGMSEVFKLESIPINYWVVDNDNLVCFVALDIFQDNTYARVKNVYSSIKNKGIASSLYKFMINMGEFKIISDTKLSPSGITLWDNLIKSTDVNVSIIDITTEEKYNIDDVAKKDHPKNDNRPDNKQRFFYIAEEIIREFTCLDKFISKPIREASDSRGGMIMPNTLAFNEGP